MNHFRFILKGLAANCGFHPNKDSNDQFTVIKKNLRTFEKFSGCVNEFEPTDLDGLTRQSKEMAPQPAF